MRSPFSWLSSLTLFLPMVAAFCGGDIEHGGRCWHFNHSEADFSQARLACQGWGGDLASVHSDADSEFIQEQLALEGDDAGTWIGLWRNSSGTPWHWADGSQRLYDGSWAFGKPSISSQEPVCVRAVNGENGVLWEDAECGSVGGGWACSRPSSGEVYNMPLPNVSSFVCDALNGVWEAGSSKCFFVPTGRVLSWSDAEAECSLYGGHLASITSRPEEEIARALFNADRGSFIAMWLGMTDSGSEGDWVWVDGSSGEYIGFSEQDNNKDCLVILDKGSGYADGPCANENPFICAVAPRCDGQAEANGKCWLLMGSVNLLHSEAQEACHEWGGELARVSSADDAVLRDTLGVEQHAGRRAWIGLQRADGSSAWAWQGGSGLEPWGARWEEGEPAGSANCATVGGEALTWAGGQCETERARDVVCSKLMTAGCDTGLAVAGRCFMRAEVGAVTYREAQAWCEGEFGGGLASVHSEAEAALLQTESSAWIGLRRGSSEEVWRWEDGTVRLFDCPWAAGRPNVASAGEVCVKAVGSASGSVWVDADCEDVAEGLVCSKSAAPPAQVRAQGACDWQAAAHGKCWLAVQSVGVEYATAAAYCAEWGGGVASVRSQAESSFLLALTGGAESWIGLRRGGAGSGWGWVDGSSPRVWWGGAWRGGAAPTEGAEGCVVSSGAEAATAWEARGCGERARGFVCARGEGWCDGDLQQNWKCWVAATAAAATAGEAAAACRAWGGELASIRSAAEQETAGQLVEAGQRAWIGLRRGAGSGGRWRWDDGSLAVAHEAWDPAAPPAREAAACATTDGRRWFDEDCESASAGSGFLCSKFRDPACNGDLHLEGKCWLGVRDVDLDWHAADGVCQEWGGRLASLRGPAEQDLVNLMDGKKPPQGGRWHDAGVGESGLGLAWHGHSFWVGLARSHSGAMFRWVDGTPPMFGAGVWRHDRPTIVSTQTVCAYMQGEEGLLVDLECNATTVQSFVCNKYTDPAQPAPTLPNSTCDGQVEKDGKCYLQVLQAKLTYFEAQAECASWGGSLASVRSPEDYDTMGRVSDTAYPSGLHIAQPGDAYLGMGYGSGQTAHEWWIGLRRPNLSTMFRWEDGTPPMYGYVRWGWRQPDLVESGDICVRYKEHDAWDVDCNVRVASFVCNKYTDPAQPAPTLPNSTCDGQVEKDGKCYLQVLQAKLTYFEAQAECASWGGSLASVRSPEDYDTMGRVSDTAYPSGLHIAQPGDAYLGMGYGSGQTAHEWWIGLRRPNLSTMFRWEDGTPPMYGYVRWGWRQPALLSSSDICVRNKVRYTEPDAGDVDCNVRVASFVCNKYTDPAQPAPTLPNSTCDGQVEKDGKCYLQVLQAKLTYFEAQAECAAWGGSLASVRSPEDYDTMGSVSDTAYPSGLHIAQPGDAYLGMGYGSGQTAHEWWIGLRRPNLSTMFRWEDGTPPMYGYVRWGWRQPALSSSSDICVRNKVRYTEPDAGDVDCHVRVASFVCNKYTDAQPAPTLPNSTCDGQVEKDGKCYLRVLQAKLTYFEAQAECAAWGGVLASAASSWERDTIRLFGDGSRPDAGSWPFVPVGAGGLAMGFEDNLYWVGLRRRNSDSVWAFEEGSRRWADSSPRSWWALLPTREGKCVLESGRWLRQDTFPCSVRVDSFVCSKPSAASQPFRVAAFQGCDGQLAAHGQCWLWAPSVWLRRDSAAEYCRQWGGELATVESAEAGEALGRVLDKYSGSWHRGTSWIGLQSLHHEQGWWWADGTALSEARWKLRFESAAHRDALCSVATNSGAWLATSCRDRAQHTACSKPLPPLPPPSLSLSPVTGSTVAACASVEGVRHPASDKCFFVGGAARSFAEAEAACAWFGGAGAAAHLASVLSPTEAALVFHLWETSGARENFGPMLIGLSRSSAMASWSWTDGEAAVFTNWVGGNDGGADDCAAMATDDMEWTPFPCEHARVVPFVCPLSPDQHAGRTAAGNGTGARCDTADGEVLLNDQCWRLLQTVTGYRSADAACYDWGGRLATVAGPDEAALVRGWGAALIGLRRGEGGEPWQWPDGSGVQFADWELATAPLSEEGNCAAAGGEGWFAVGCASVSSRGVERAVCAKAARPDGGGCDGQGCEALGAAAASLVPSGCGCSCCFLLADAGGELTRVGGCAPQCHRLSFRRQGITSLGPGVFSSLSDLRMLVLSHNRIQHLHPAVFRDLQALSVLHLDNNQIGDVGSGLLSGLHRLREVYLNNNRITALRGNAFADLPSLQVLDLSSNGLWDISTGTFAELESLVHLNLGHNAVTDDGMARLLEAPKLLALRLSFNAVRALSRAPAAQHLDLYGNEVATVSHEALSERKEMRSLELGANELAWLHHRALRDLPEGVAIGAELNPWECLPLFPYGATVYLDLGLGELPLCLPRGCTASVSERFTANWTSALEGAVAERSVLGAMETSMQMLRADATTPLDDFHLRAALYVDDGSGLRCWCTAASLCFSPRIALCARPGEFGNPCRLCPPGHVCPGGNRSVPCPAGYSSPAGSWDPAQCEDEDECAAGTHACDPIANCSNTPGGYLCTCPPGWSSRGPQGGKCCPAGFEAVAGGGECVDADECAEGTARCDAAASCSNSEGSFECVCGAGWQGNGTACEDVDECEAAEACPAGYGCVNEEGGWECVDIDECQGSPCAVNATCTNGEGNYSCTCNAGYKGDGETCSDVDECREGQDACHEPASCSNTNGSFVCLCPPVTGELPGSNPTRCIAQETGANCSNSSSVCPEGFNQTAASSGT